MELTSDQVISSPATTHPDSTHFIDSWGTIASVSVWLNKPWVVVGVEGVVLYWPGLWHHTLQWYHEHLCSSWMWLYETSPDPLYPTVKEEMWTQPLLITGWIKKASSKYFIARKWERNNNNIPAPSSQMTQFLYNIFVHLINPNTEAQNGYIYIST